MTAREVRAALILLVIVVQGLAALPIPDRVRAADFETDYAKEEMAAWSALLARVGVRATAEEVGDVFFTVGRAAADARRAVVGPLGPVYRLTGTGQDWGLFTYPDNRPHRLEVAVRARDGRFETVYAGLDPARAWARDVLTYRRVRGLYDGQTDRPGASWDNLTRWIARRLLAERPDAHQVRVRFVRLHTTLPGAEPDPRELPRHARLWTREEVER